MYMDQRNKYIVITPGIMCTKDRIRTLPSSPAGEHARKSANASPRMLDPGAHNASASYNSGKFIIVILVGVDTENTRKSSRINSTPVPHRCQRGRAVAQNSLPDPEARVTIMCPAELHSDAGHATPGRSLTEAPGQGRSLQVV